MLTEGDARFRTRTFGAVCVVALLLSAAFSGATPTFYVGASIPWIAAWIYRQGEGVIRLFAGRGDPRPEVGHVYLLSMIVPVLWAVQDASFLQWDAVIIGALIVATLLASVVIKNRSDWHWAQILGLVFLNSFYGFGLVAALNQDLDHNPPKIRPAYVLERRESHSRRADFYYLKLGPWGPRATAQELKVTYREYIRARPKQVVCIDLHPGAFQMSWTEVKACSTPVN